MLHACFTVRHRRSIAHKQRYAFTANEYNSLHGQFRRRIYPVDGRTHTRDSGDQFARNEQFDYALTTNE